MLNMNEMDILKKADLILQHIDQDKKVGDDYNIFSILAIERAEVKHSKILADLLNPEGLHKHGDLFLQFFLEKFMKDKIGDFTNFCKKVNVSTEQSHIVDNQQGYIDIVVETKDIAIVIENKIDALDQPKQLQRYMSSKAVELSNIFVIYLTLDGKKASEDSRGSLNNEEIIYLSYEEHITEWIQQCIIDTLHENIKVVLMQYLAIIEKITNQNSKKENKELTKLLLEDGNMSIAMKIQNALEWAKATIEMEFFKTLYENLKDDLKRIGFEIYNGDDWEWTFDDKYIERIKNIRKYNSKKDSFNGLYFYRKSTMSDKCLYIRFGVDKDYCLWLDCFIGTSKKIEPVELPKHNLNLEEWDEWRPSCIILEGEDFEGDIQFVDGNKIYEMSQDCRFDIARSIAEKSIGVLENSDVKELFEILLKN